MAQAVIAVAAVATAYTGYKSYQETKKAGDAQQRAQEAQQRRATEQNRLKTVKALREERIARARATQQAVNVGVQDSSGLAGTTSSIGSQTSANIGFLNRDIQNISTYNQAMSQYYQSANQASLWGSIGSTVTGVAGLGLQAYGAGKK